jgi:hypothetical protein
LEKSTTGACYSARWFALTVEIVGIFHLVKHADQARIGMLDRFRIAGCDWRIARP